MDEIIKEESEGTEAPLSEEKKSSPVKDTAKRLAKRWFIDAFSGMAQGLFCTLIAGTILAQIASWLGDNAFAHTLDYIAKIAKSLMGAGIGVGIAYKLKASPLVVFTAAVTGLVGAFATAFVNVLVKGASFTFFIGDASALEGLKLLVTNAPEKIRMWARLNLL